MEAMLFKGVGTQRADNLPIELPPSPNINQPDPAQYVTDGGLTDAVNVALLLRLPLLLTGEPGTGKTQLAYRLAWELGLNEPLVFEIKSTSTAQDLFYTYDALARFQARESGASANVLSYLTCNALGTAMLFASRERSARNLLPTESRLAEPCRSVVLIDELDKAPRDLPNDILNEIEQMYFRIPELGHMKIAADPDLAPIVVITSNSEKDLPDAFLRRCIYYNIPFPDQGTLSAIIGNRLGDLAGNSSPLLSQALEVFFMLRQPDSGLRKKPATAELIVWLTCLRKLMASAESRLAESPQVTVNSLGCLVKSADDQSKARERVKRWLDQQNR